MFGPDFPAEPLVLFNRELDPMLMNELDQRIKRHITFHFPIYRRNNTLEAVAILFNKFLFEYFDCPVELNFLF